MAYIKYAAARRLRKPWRGQEMDDPAAGRSRGWDVRWIEG
jgi:hypothetical protein